MTFVDRLAREVEAIREAGQLRTLRELAPAGRLTSFEGKELLNLSSNDYLGLGVRDDLRKEFYTPLISELDSRDYHLSASSSRLLTGNHPGYLELEGLLESLYGRPSLVFNSGYHANIGILPALATWRDLVLSDKLNHASIIDGMRLCDAKFKRYPHLGYDRLESILEKERDRYERIFIVSESIFSMDGDTADLARLVELKKKFDAVLILDEAHSAGLIGERGLGLAEREGLIDGVDIIIGTFGKAYCSAGAYAIMDGPIKEYLINTMRSFIFTTALPPVVVGWSRFILEKSLSMSDERNRLQSLSTRLREGLVEAGFETLGDSQIVPLLTGGNEKALALAERMRKAGILVFAIRPPTVPPGGARLRFSLTSALTNSDIDAILEVL